MGKKHQIKLKLSKSLRLALSNANPEDDLLKRLSSIEQRLSKIERAQATSPGVRDDVGMFFMDADQSAQPSQHEAYRSWLAHFEKEPDAIEPGRTDHEMAALAASKGSLKQSKGTQY